MITKNSLRLILVCLFFSCIGKAQEERHVKHDSHPTLSAAEPVLFQVGAEQVETYIDRLRGKRIAVVANQTSYIAESHLVDSLLSLGIDVKQVYAPEHGFRGDQGAGAHISDEVDVKTGLPIYSLHGKTKKPSAASLKDIDLVLFDIQDVGVRFYTYISTLHYVMEACAEADIPLMILDRPNPHISYTPDGPVLDTAFSSFIGMHPVPVLYGLTIGEYGLMINGQGWLAGGVQTELTVISCAGYNRTMDYPLPIAPSPNLPNQKSINLYPSLCFFEGTVVSVGRGTDRPFQWIGHPDFQKSEISFTPLPNAASKYPKLEGKRCKGISFSEGEASIIKSTKQLELQPLLDFYHTLDMGDTFFRTDGFFDLLAGTDKLRTQIQEGKTVKEIRDSWQEDLAAYGEIWRLYRLYE